MKRASYMIAIIFLISVVVISFSKKAAISLQESLEVVEAEVIEYKPDYNVTGEPVDEDQEVYIKPDYNVTEEAVDEDEEIYIKPDTEAIPDTEVEDADEEDRYWWEDEQSNSEETIFEDPNQQSQR